MLKPLSIPARNDVRRRKQLMRMAGDDAILILPSAKEVVRSRDTHYPYRQDSDFSYLTGFPEPEAVLVLVPGRAHGETLLFCRERDPEREGWDGPRYGPCQGFPTRISAPSTSPWTSTESTTTSQ
jgi:Xaa-Pro aminopeptidase